MHVRRSIAALLLATGWIATAGSQPSWPPDWLTMVPDGIGYGSREPDAVVGAVARDPATGSVYLLGNGVMRLSADGVVEHVGGWTWPDFNHEPVVEWAAAADTGDVIVSADDHCTLAALDHAGAVRWWRRLELSGRHCSQPVLVDGAVLVLERVVQADQDTTELLRIQADGKVGVLANVDAPGGTGFELDRDAGSGELVLSWLAAGGSSSPEPVLHVLRVNAQGQQRWHWQRVGLQRRSLLATADGGALLLGIENSVRTLIRLGGQGQELSRSTWPADDGLAAGGGWLGRDGTLYLMDWSNAQMRRRLRVIDGAGAETGRFDREGAFCENLALHCRAWLADNGDLVLTGGGFDHENRVERYGAEAGLRFEHVFADPPSTGLPSSAHRARIHLLGDGQLIQVRGVDPDNNGWIEEPVVQVLDPAGAAGPAVTLPPRAREYFDYEAAVAYSDGDGWSFVVVDRPEPRLTAIRPSGVPAWTVPLSTRVGAPFVGPSALASCGDAGIAVAMLDGVACHERSNGSRRWLVTGSGGRFGRSVHTLSGGRLLAAQFEHGQSLLLETASGSQVTVLDPSAEPLAVHPQRGAAFRGAAGTIVLLSPQGQVTELAGPGLVPAEARIAALGEDGELTLVHASDVGSSPDSARLEVWRVAGGALRWHRIVEEIPGEHGYIDVRIQQLANGDSALLYSHSQDTDGLLTDDRVRVGLLRVGADGETRWRRHWSPATFRDTRIAGEHAGRVLLSATRTKARELLLFVLDGGDGASLRQVRVDCPELACGNDNVHVLPDGAVIVAGRSAGPTGLDVPVQRLSGLFAPVPAIALGQAGLGGQWYADYGGGQGLALTWFAGAETLFLPWFTFDREGGSDPRHQRWYTLQAQVAPGATQAELPILQSIGGRFDRPGSTLAAVGQARLRLSSCHEGLLDYRFDEGHNGGAQGSIALRRLLPSGAGCIGSGGVEEPAQASYDAAYSGHWFDPAAAGQGLDIQRIAPAAGGPGLLFATWFTYDPVAPSNQPEDQHWFTLQGQSAAGEGAIRTTIVQTLGGRFDDRPTVNHHRVGEVVLRTLACDRMRLSYVFDDSDLAGAFRGLSGDIDLHRLGDCP